MNVTLIALYDVHSHAIRGFHSFLLREGYKVRSIYFKTSTYIDKMYTQHELNQLLELIKYTEPDIIGISVRSPLFPLFKDLSALIRQHLPGVQIIVGGHHPTADPESCFPYADHIVAGEGEIALLQILQGKAKGFIKGEVVQDLDLPLPYYGFGCYLLNAKLKTNKMSCTTARGCYFDCSYCHQSILHDMYGPGIRRKSPTYAALDMLNLHKMFGAYIFSISDPIFADNTDWLDEFAGIIRSYNFGFFVSIHPNVSSYETLKALNNTGRVHVRTGVQSGSEYIRERIFSRKDTLAKILEVAEWIDELKMIGHYDFIIENPYDTPETIKETRDFIDKLPQSSRIHKYELRWFPGTPLTKRALEDGYIEQKDIDGQYTRLGNWDYNYSKWTPESQIN